MVGTLMVDIVAPWVDGFKPGANYIVEVESCFGGGGGNVAYHLAHLKDEVALVAGLGRDPLGQAYEDSLRRLGVRLYLARGPRTGVLIAITFKGGERSFLADPGANASVNREIVLEAIEDFKPDIIVLHGYLLVNSASREALLEAAKASEKLGVRIVFDPAYYNMNRVELEAALTLLKYTHIIVPNEDEVKVLAGMQDPLKAARMIAGRYNATVYLKRGSKGATLVNARKVIHAYPPPVDLVNTVGSGDAFTAMIAHGLLHRWTPEKMLKNATYIASQIARCKCPQCNLKQTNQEYKGMESYILG